MYEPVHHVFPSGFSDRYDTLIQAELQAMYRRVFCIKQQADKRRTRYSSHLRRFACPCCRGNLRHRESDFAVLQAPKRCPSAANPALCRINQLPKIQQLPGEVVVSLLSSFETCSLLLLRPRRRRRPPITPRPPASEHLQAHNPLRLTNQTTEPPKP